MKMHREQRCSWCNRVVVVLVDQYIGRAGMLLHHRARYSWTDGIHFGDRVLVSYYYRIKYQNPSFQ